MDWHTGGKWLTHGPKIRKDNQSYIHIRYLLQSKSLGCYNMHQFHPWHKATQKLWWWICIEIRDTQHGQVSLITPHFSIHWRLLKIDQDRFFFQWYDLRRCVLRPLYLLLIWNTWEVWIGIERSLDGLELGVGGKNHFCMRFTRRQIAWDTWVFYLD